MKKSIAMDLINPARVREVLEETPTKLESLSGSLDSRRSADMGGDLFMRSAFSPGTPAIAKHPRESELEGRCSAERPVRRQRRVSYTELH